MQKNPLTMVGTIDRCWLFTYQTPEAEARRHLPFPLKPVTHRGFGFWNVVVCHVDAMRPKGTPRWMGVSYWHIAYRLYVRYPVVGEDVQGLYFVRSDCDSALMAAAGNVMTDFNFHAASIRAVDGRIDVGSIDAGGHAIVQPESPTALPRYSAFDHLDQAARFLKYKPFGISVRPKGDGNVVRIVRDERAWHARLVVAQANWAFFDGMDVRPEICYEVDPIDYQWNRAYRVRLLDKIPKGTIAREVRSPCLTGLIKRS